MAASAFGFSTTRIEIEVTSASVELTEIGTTAPFSAISGASSFTLSEASAVLPYSDLIASSLFFCLNASSGYLSLAAAKAGVRPKRMPARPINASTAAPFRTSRRVESMVSIGCFITFSSEARRSSQRLQKIYHRIDFLLGQNAIPAERGHHGQRIAFGFVKYDRNQFVTIRILLLDVDQLGTDGARQVAALDDVTGEAVAFAAIESELLALGDGGLRTGRT